MTTKLGSTSLSWLLIMSIHDLVLVSVLTADHVNPWPLHLVLVSVLTADHVNPWPLNLVLVSVLTADHVNP